MNELSPKAKIYLFINKMDKIKDESKNQNFLQIKEFFEKSEINKHDIIFLPTSIWDISLYKAWTNIFSDFLPKTDKIKELLKKFVTASWADEAVLLEKNTLVKICSFNDREIKDNDRFEKITDVIKKLKNSCKYDSKIMKEIMIKTINNIIYVDDFENSSYIIVAFRNQKTTLELIKINIEICKNSFKELFDIV